MRNSGPTMGLAGCLATVFAFCVPASAAGADQAETFRWRDGRLVVRSQRLELVFGDAAVVGLRDLRTGEWLTRPIGQAATGPAGAAPAGGPAAAKLERVGPLEVRLVCPPPRAQALRPPAPGPALKERVYDFRVDAGTGEILVQAIWESADANHPPASGEVPVETLAGRSLLLGCGAEFRRDEPACRDATSRISNGLHGPAFAAAVGERSCVAVWQDSPQGYGNILLAHEPASDTLTLASKRNPLLAAGGRCTFDAWRFGAFDRWEDAARAYRRHYQHVTPARPLWDNRCSWVRRIHAVSTACPNDGPQAREIYSRLAAALDPNAVLLFYWNGDRIILFGDHRYMTGIGRPTPEVIDQIKAFGFRWMGYHPYFLIMPPREVPKRLKMIRDRGWGVPEGYAFEPDYDGPAGGFWDYFRPISAGYYHPLDEADLWLAHPGAAKFRKYLLRNCGDYCRVHRMDGAYMDVLGADSEHHFPPEKLVMEGNDLHRGEAGAQQQLHRALPEIATMSEYQSSWMVPEVWYSWEGATHFTLQASYRSIRTRRNHPIRTALWGSYCWARQDGIDPCQAALIGALPEIDLNDDWSVARARLFAAEALFPDLPDRWPDGAVACYRGRGGRWFQYRTMPFGEAFVAAGSGRPRVLLGRFIGQSASLLPGPVHIQGWVACRGGKPFGLDPRRVYDFIPGEPNVPGPVLVTGLPAGQHMVAARNEKGYSVLEFGRTDGKPPAGKVTFVPRRPCRAVLDAAGQQARDLPADRPATVQAAGNLVLLWDDPPAVQARPDRNWFQSTGRVFSAGRAEVTYYIGSGIRSAPDAQAGGQKRQALQFALGHYRTYGEGWVQLPPDADAALGFAYAIDPPPPAGRQAADMILTVAVNGNEVFREPLTKHDAWLTRSVPLARYTGQKVLLTLSVQATGFRDIPDGRIHTCVYLAGAHVAGLAKESPAPPGSAYRRPSGRDGWLVAGLKGPE